MMILRGVIAATVFLLLPGCAARETAGGSGTAVGTVVVSGNMPFSRVMLRVDGSTTYLLRCAPALDDSLRGMQGLLVRVRFSGARESPEGMALDVVHAEAVQNIQHR